MPRAAAHGQTVHDEQGEKVRHRHSMLWGCMLEQTAQTDLREYGGASGAVEEMVGKITEKPGNSPSKQAPWRRARGSFATNE